MFTYPIVSSGAVALPGAGAVQFINGQGNYFSSAEGCIDVDHQKMTCVWMWYGDSYIPSTGVGGSLLGGSTTTTGIGYFSGSPYGFEINLNQTNAFTRTLQDTTTNVMPTGQWTALMFAIDGVAGTAVLYSNGSSVESWSGFPGVTFRDHAQFANHLFGKSAAGTNGPNARVSFFWMHNNYYDPATDWSSFFSANKPKYIGENGELAVGVQPKSYFPEGDPRDNRGTLGNWSMVGTVGIVAGPNA